MSELPMKLELPFTYVHKIFKLNNGKEMSYLYFWYTVKLYSIKYMQAVKSDSLFRVLSVVHRNVMQKICYEKKVFKYFILFASLVKIQCSDMLY